MKRIFFYRSLFKMRNTTKLKQILLKYDLDLSMDEDGLMKLTLVDKISGKAFGFEHSAYSSLISKGYTHFLKEIKSGTTDLKNKNWMHS